MNDKFWDEKISVELPDSDRASEQSPLQSLANGRTLLDLINQMSVVADVGSPNYEMLKMFIDAEIARRLARSAEKVKHTAIYASVGLGGISVMLTLVGLFTVK